MAVATAWAMRQDDFSSATNSRLRRVHGHLANLAWLLDGHLIGWPRAAQSMLASVEQIEAEMRRRGLKYQPHGLVVRKTPKPRRKETWI